MGYAVSLSDSIEIETPYIGQISDSTRDALAAELDAHLLADLTSQVEMYNSDISFRKNINSLFGFKKKKDAEEYFKSLQQQNADIVQSVRTVAPNMNGIPSQPPFLEGLLDTRITTIGHQSMGAIYIVFSYRTNIFVTKANNVTTPAPLVLGGIQYDGPSFFLGGELLATVDTENKELIVYDAMSSHNEFQARFSTWATCEGN